MLGFMGDDPHETVASMRSWQQACCLVITPSSRETVDSMRSWQPVLGPTP